MVNIQMLAELEEVIQFKLVLERREVIREMWWNRLRVQCFPSCRCPSSSCPWELQGWNYRPAAFAGQM